MALPICQTPSLCLSRGCRWVVQTIVQLAKYGPVCLHGALYATSSVSPTEARLTAVERLKPHRNRTAT